MTGLYNRSPLSPFTRATAEAVNAETSKIEAAINALKANMDSIVAGTPIAAYTWIAYADSADGTANFTTGEPAGRYYIGIAYGRGSPIESNIPSDYSWTRLRGNDGSDATSGADGLSVVEKFVFRRSATQPATPTGGSFNFSTQATTAPASWSTSVPAGTDPVWVSVAVAAKQGVGGTASFGAWSVPAKAFENGTNGSDGANGVDGYSVDVIFRRSAVQPATPAPSAITPAGWYSSVNSVPAGPNALFSCFGKRTDALSNFVWQLPVLVEGQPGLTGNDGADGADGKLVEFIWRRAVTQPATPTGNGIPAGWSDDPPAGSDPLWMSKAKQELDGTLVVSESWSIPVRHDGPPGPSGASGGSTFTLINVANTDFPAPNRVRKAAGVNAAWDAKARTAEKYERPAISVTVFPASDGIFGLDPDTNDGVGDTNIAYAVHLLGDKSVRILANGALLHTTPANFVVAGDVVSIGPFQGQYGVFKNGTHFGPTIGAPAPGILMHGVVAMAINGFEIGAIAFSGTGADGAAGVSQRRIWRRDVVQPATPVPSAGTPAGWSDNHATAPGSGILWRADGERASGGTNYVWVTPLRDEVLNQVTGTGLPVALDIGLSATLGLGLAAGQSRTVFAQARAEEPSGFGSWYIQIEYRQAGGAWVASNGGVSGYAPLEPTSVFHSITLNAPAGGSDLLYEIRASVITTGASPGNLDPARSLMRV